MGDFTSGLALIFYVMIPAAIGIFGIIIYKLMELIKRKSLRIVIYLVIALCLLVVLVLLGYLNSTYEGNDLITASTFTLAALLALGLATTFSLFEEYLGFRWHEVCIFACSMAAAFPALFVSAFFSSALFSWFNEAEMSGSSLDAMVIILPLSMYVVMLLITSVFYAIAAMAFQVFIMVKKKLIKSG